MYYAIIYLSNDCFEKTIFDYSDLDDIASVLLDECDTCIDSMDMSLKELEDEYYCEFDDYRKVRKALKKDELTFDMLKDFQFYLSDMRVSLCSLDVNYKDFYESYYDHIDGNFVFENWRIPEALDEADAHRLIKELSSINDDDEVDEYRIIKNIEDE